VRAIALLAAPIALAATSPAFAQDHTAHRHRPPPATTAPANPHTTHADQSQPAHAADLHFDRAEMERARALLLFENGGMPTSAFFVDRLEATFSDDHEGYAWDAQGWRGGDIHRFWWKSEGEGAFDGDVEYAELQLLYSRAITPYFDVQTGVRQSYRPQGDRTDLVVGLQGLAPYLFEVSAEAFVSNEGEFTARGEAEYDLRLTQRLILQPSAELGFSADEIPEFAIGAGFTDLELGARLRYEIRRDFAPYVGVEWHNALGDTRDIIEASGEDADSARFVIGIHTWF